MSVGDEVIKRSGWRNGLASPPGGLCIDPARPNVVHQLELRKIQEWLRAPGKSPSEILMKSKVRESWKV
jgi:hypothetical protein